MAAAAYGAEAVTVWDLDEDRAHAALATAGPAGARNPLRAVCGLAFSPDGTTLVVSRDDGSSEFWDLKSARVAKTLRLHPPGYAPTALRFTPDGVTLASLGLFKQPVTLFDVIRTGVSDLWSRGKSRPARTELVVFDLAGNRRLARLASVGEPLFSDDGRTLATVENGAPAIRLWDVPGPRGR